MKKTLYITNKLFFANWFVPVIGAVLIQVIGIIVSRRLVGFCCKVLNLLSNKVE
ncbi:hypothetical protein V2U81_10745 [Streptococcus agalactiae]